MTKLKPLLPISPPSNKPPPKKCYLTNKPLWGRAMLQEQMKVLNDVEENLFIADKDDIIEGAPIDMKIDVDGELDR